MHQLLQVPACELAEQERMMCGRCGIAIGNVHAHCSECQLDLCTLCRDELRPHGCDHAAPTQCPKPSCDQQDMALQRVLNDEQQSALMLFADSSTEKMAISSRIDGANQARGLLNTVLRGVRFDAEGESAARAIIGARRGTKRNGAPQLVTAPAVLAPALADSSAPPSTADERREKLRRAAMDADYDSLPTVLAEHAHDQARDVWAPSEAEANRFHAARPASLAAAEEHRVRLVSWANDEEQVRTRCSAPPAAQCTLQRMSDLWAC